MNMSTPVALLSTMHRIALIAFISFISIPFLTAQVSSSVDFHKADDTGVNLINIIWSDMDQQQWKSENEGRLEIMSVSTNIVSSSLPVSNIETTSFRFSLKESANIEILLNIQVLVPGEKISFIDAKTGQIIYDVTETNQQKILTPVFDPQTTYLVWSHEPEQSYKSIFTIEYIYVHDAATSRDRGIGFGTAEPCHPNAACKQDSLLKLISKSEVRIRMVMDEGIGWCSGTFVNNTRNDKTPYILTAFHCTFEYTPQYDLWRFDLLYKSDSCANPAEEPVFFSLTGCQLKAKGQGSDFLLVQLDNDVPVNQQVTFAGWNRDELEIPDTVFMVHHPNADIRKLSTCTSGTVIHPNQIGWSEGYTTPANHHFRFKFTEGGHQPGSSGGGVFNPEGLLISQLHGGSAGCETNNTAFSGRLAKSWNFGTTADDRLSDWLDPDQTGVLVLPSIENIQKNDLVEIVGLVLDPKGRPVKNVEISISGSMSQSITTDSTGHFTFSSVNRQGQYTITPAKDDYQTNGINVIDLIAIQNHLLGKDTFDFPWQHIAADATNNNNNSVGDIVVLQRLLLGKITHLPSSPSWRFDPPAIMLDQLPPGNQTQVEFKAIKIGDLNNTANPSK